MISNGSLAAFSAAALGNVAARPVQQAAARSPAPSGNAVSPRVPMQAAPGQPTPNPNLPRGSLLDLSV